MKKAKKPLAKKSPSSNRGSTPPKKGAKGIKIKSPVQGKAKGKPKQKLKFKAPAPAAKKGAKKVVKKILAKKKNPPAPIKSAKEAELKKNQAAQLKKMKEAKAQESKHAKITEKAKIKEAKNLAKLLAKEEQRKAKLKGKGTDEDLEGDLTLADKMLSSKKVLDVPENVTDKLMVEVLNLIDRHSIEDLLLTLRDLKFFHTDTDECLEKGCDNVASTSSYCRLHYIKNWEVIKKKEAILKDGKLQDIIMELFTKYPIKNIEAILADLTDEKTFFGVLRELNIDAADEEAFDVDDDVTDDDQDIAYETSGKFRAVGEE